MATIFQHPAWFEGHGAKAVGFLGMVFSDSAGGAVRGIALWERPFPMVWRLAGSTHSDYADLLAEPGFEDRVAESFASHMANRSGWSWIDLPQVRPGSVASRIPGASGVVGETCPGCDLPSDWDSFHRSLGKSLRSNIGYYARAIAKSGEMEIRTADATTVDTDLESFFELHQRRWRSRWMPGAFADQRSRAAHRSVAKRLLDAGRLRLHTLLVDGTAVASLYCFAGVRETFYYLGGFDPAWSKHSPGTVLTAHAIRHAIEVDGSCRFDFLRGNESYKYKWGAQDRHNMRMRLVRGALGRGLSSLGVAGLGLELALKDRMHARFGGAGKPGAGPSRQDAGVVAGNKQSRLAVSPVADRSPESAPIVQGIVAGQAKAER